MTWGGGAAVPLLSPLGLFALTICFLIGGWMRLHSRRTLVLISTTLIVAPLIAFAASVPNVFTNGTVADADQVNANFTAVTDAITLLECVGNPASGDSDRDGVCNDSDVCAGGRDDTDIDQDGVPDACDPCPLDNPNDFNNNSICDSQDVIFGFTSGPPAASLCIEGHRSALFDAVSGTLYICGNAGWVSK
jgi:hypothetical protein